MCDCSICLTFSLLRYMLLNKFLFKSGSHNIINKKVPILIMLTRYKKKTLTRSNHPDCDVPSDVQNRDGYRLKLHFEIPVVTSIYTTIILLYY